jgi:hypothetical protein
MALMKSLKRQNSMTAMTAPSQPKVATIAGRCAYAKLVERYIKRVPIALWQTTEFSTLAIEQLSKRIGSTVKVCIALPRRG